MNTIIISAFPATGKTHLFENNSSELKMLDSDSSDFSWIKDEDGNNTKERHPDFPKNYMDHIKSNIGKVDMIFVSSHSIVRDALSETGLNYLLFYPSIKLKSIYLDRFKNRGNNEGFINFLANNWDAFITECSEQKGCIKIEMESGFLSNYFK